jgi:hypothetical protein
VDYRNQLQGGLVSIQTHIRGDWGRCHRGHKEKKRSEDQHFRAGEKNGVVKAKKNKSLLTTRWPAFYSVAVLSTFDSIRLALSLRVQAQARPSSIVSYKLDIQAYFMYSVGI